MGTGGNNPRDIPPELEADQSPPLSAQTKKAWRSTSTPPVRLHSVVLN